MNNNSDSPVQLSLGVSLHNECTFENFYSLNSGNKVPLSSLKDLVTCPEPSTHLLWGKAGAGLTHLLHAFCRRCYEYGNRVQYIPLNNRCLFFKMGEPNVHVRCLYVFQSSP